MCSLDTKWLGKERSHNLKHQLSLISKRQQKVDVQHNPTKMQQLQQAWLKLQWTLHNRKLQWASTHRILKSTKSFTHYSRSYIIEATCQLCCKSITMAQPRRWDWPIRLILTTRLDWTKALNLSLKKGRQSGQVEKFKWIQEVKNTK